MAAPLLWAPSAPPGDGVDGHAGRPRRHAALKIARGRDLRQELAEKGIYARAASREGLAEEIPEAYKDVNDVVEVCSGAGISKLVARLRPLGVMKG
jgi:tRNA-splicing ligase RtcB